MILLDRVIDILYVCRAELHEYRPENRAIIRAIDELIEEYYKETGSNANVTN